jgi:CRISPR/Cas system endoribonuclease Cas6 (RAMP superfamily)
MNSVESFLKSVRVYIQRAENYKYLDLRLQPKDEIMLEKLDPELYKKYLEVKLRNMKEREKFKQEIVRIALQIQDRLRKYGVEVTVDFDTYGYPQYYHLFVRLPRNQQLSEDLLKQFIAELEAIGLVYIPGVDNWGYMAKFGEYPPFKL